MAKDPSAMGLLKWAEFSTGTDQMNRWRLDLAARHARNVDKQRRRLLAERLALRAVGFVSVAQMLPGPERAKRRNWYFDHATKLRALAARLRGEK